MAPKAVVDIDAAKTHFRELAALHGFHEALAEHLVVVNKCRCTDDLRCMIDKDTNVRKDFVAHVQHASGLASMSQH